MIPTPAGLSTSLVPEGRRGSGGTAIFGGGSAELLGIATGGLVPLATVAFVVAAPARREPWPRAPAGVVPGRHAVGAEKMSTTRPSPETTGAFAAAIGVRDEQLPLDRAAALLARGIAYPDLDVDRVLDRLDRLAAPLRDRLPAHRDPRDAVVALSDYLAGELGFRGNDDDYDDPRNSLLNDILDRRLGIPIGLSLVYIEVARRAGFSLVGVGFPAHFLVKHAAGGALEDDLYLDPYHGGALVAPAQLRERIERAYGGRLPFEPHYLGAVTKKQLLTRLLLNLKADYAARNDARRTLAVVEFLLLLAPWDLDQRRDRGFLSLQLGDPARALEDLRLYEQYAAGDPNLPIIRGYIEALQRRFALGG